MEEPSLVLRAVTYHFASGQAWWCGLAMLLLAVRLQRANWSSGKVIGTTLLGLVEIGLSGWPAITLQILLAGVVIAWLVRVVGPRWFLGLSVSCLSRAVQMSVVLVIVLEFPWWIGPWQSLPNIDELAVIGDSVTAGLNDHDVTWPRVLANTGRCIIWDASQQGATVQSAAQQLARLDGRGKALLIEIGGNDLLEGLPVDLFAERLRHLLVPAQKQYDSIVMLELPLPPLSNRYGMAQRRLARELKIPLVPKRELARVLTTAGSTVDGIHLSDRGQARLADTIGDWLGLNGRVRPTHAYHRVDVR